MGSAMAMDRDKCKTDEDCNVEEQETCAQVYPYLGALFAAWYLDFVPNGVIPCRINKDCPKGYACNGAYVALVLAWERALNMSPAPMIRKCELEKNRIRGIQETGVNLFILRQDTF